MQRRNPAITEEFADAVGQFLADHWLGSREPAHWRLALAERGWAVPDWPLAEGGLGWSAQQSRYWQNCCIAAAAPLPDLLTTRGIAPLLRERRRGPSAAWLDGIRTLRERWCVVAAEPGIVADSALTLRSSADHYLLQGRVRPVAHALDSQWALCAAELLDSSEPVLVAVSLAASGLQTTPMPMVGEVSGGRTQTGVQLATLDFSDVPVPEAHLLCTGASVHGWLERLVGFAPALDPARSSAAAIAVDLADLAMLAAVDAISADVDPVHAGLGVRLAALKVLEARVLGARADAPALELMQRHQALQLKLDVADALSAALGYHLLPYADPDLSHNEPVAGPPLAQERVAALLRDRGLLAAHDPLGEQISRIGGLLGLAPDASKPPQGDASPDLAQGLPKAAKKP